jgi:putative PEP-CTERM system histidine kinase
VLDGDWLGDFIALLAYGVLLLHLASTFKGTGVGDRAGRWLLAAVGATAAWAAASASERLFDWPGTAAAVLLLDLARYGLWFAFLLCLLAPLTQGLGRRRVSVWAWAAFAAMAVNIASILLIAAQVPLPIQGTRLLLSNGLALPVLALIMLEQLFRNQPEEARWNAKPVCLGLACVFGFDLYLYSDALMFGQLDGDASNVRGAIHALAVPLLFVASRRHPAWLSKLKVSRQAAFFSAALLLTGGYLMFIAGVGYYVRFFGGSWGRALQLAVVFGALVLLAALAFSGSLRARLRVFLGKNFFRYRYDYRTEWLRFTAMLATRGSPQEVGTLVVRGLADMVESPAGTLWTRGLDDGFYVTNAQWSASRPPQTEAVDSPLCRFMCEKDWIIDIAEFRSSPRRYGDLVLPMWLVTDPQAWVVVPLMAGGDMVGFVVLNAPRTPVELNWEVRDLLKTASRQAAGYLGGMQAAEALLEARKFDAFNRMSAFVVHDLKNIITQLSLMLKNAERLRDNREFQNDMLETVESSLEKMRQMMLQLREGQKPVGVSSGVQLEKLVRDLENTARMRGRHVEVEVVDAVATRGHEERVARVLGHLVQNALDATPSSGRVWVTLRKDAGRAMVTVGDTGVGMTPEFVQTRLFRPFSSTKQSGMGIGTYESFHYVKELGGQVEVQSEPGRGTTITVLLPLFESRNQSDLLIGSR